MLSPREREVLSLVAEGMSASEIGRKLLLSEYTVRDNLKSVYRKMPAKNRAHAVAEALRKGVIS